MQNKHLLTERQTEVMELLSQGYKIRAVAKKLIVEESTIKTHLQQIYNRFGILSEGIYDSKILAINKYNKMKAEGIK